MNKITSLFFVLIVVFGTFFANSSTAHAADTYTYSVTSQCTPSSMNGQCSSVHTVTFNSPYELVGYVRNGKFLAVHVIDPVYVDKTGSWVIKKIPLSNVPHGTRIEHSTVDIRELEAGGDYISMSALVGTDIPYFSTRSAAIAYADTGDDSEQINKIDYSILVDEQPFVEGNMDFTSTDTFFLQDYYLDGFFADFDINARWKGVHIPNKLAQWYDKGSIDITKKEVAIMFTYTHKDYYTDTFVKYYPNTFNADDLKCKIDVSKFAPDNENYYLSKVSFIPIINIIYYNSGMGVSITPNVTYYGSMSHVNYDINGSATGSDFNSGDINGNTDGGYGLGDDDYNGIGGITGDINDTMDTFADTLTSLSSVGSKISGVVGTFFGWLPWWAISLIGCAIGAAVLLRFLGR